MSLLEYAQLNNVLPDAFEQGMKMPLELQKMRLANMAQQESIATAQQERRQSAEKHPLTLAEMGLRNTQLGLGNTKTAFENEVNQKYGVEKRIRDLDQEWAGKEIKKSTDAAKLVGTYAAALNGVDSNSLEGQAALQEVTKSLSRWMPPQVAAQMTKGGAEGMRKIAEGIAMNESAGVRATEAAKVKAAAQIAADQRRVDREREIHAMDNQTRLIGQLIAARSRENVANTNAAARKAGGTGIKDPKTLEEEMIRIRSAMNNLDPADPEYETKHQLLKERFDDVRADFFGAKDNTKDPATRVIGQDANGKDIIGPNRAPPTTKQQRADAAKNPSPEANTFTAKNGKTYSVGEIIPHNGKKYQLIDNKGTIKEVK